MTQPSPLLLPSHRPSLGSPSPQSQPTLNHASALIPSLPPWCSCEQYYCANGKAIPPFPLLPVGCGPCTAAAASEGHRCWCCCDDLPWASLAYSSHTCTPTMLPASFSHVHVMRPNISQPAVMTTHSSLESPVLENCYSRHHLKKSIVPT